MSSPVKRARELRQQMTLPEKLLWKLLRNRKWKGNKVRRQHPIIYAETKDDTFYYVADFYFAESKLIVELDGKHHWSCEQLEFDRRRDMILNEMNYRILRINNEELKDLQAVMNKIEAALPLSTSGEGTEG